MQLIVADDGGLELLRQCDGIGHVVAMSVRDGHDVDLVERVQFLRRRRVTLDPWIQQNGLRAARDELERVVA